MELASEAIQHKRGTNGSTAIYDRTSKCYVEECSSSEEDSKPDTSFESHRLSSLYRGTWPVKRDTWTGQQMGYTGQQTLSANDNEMGSVINCSPGSACSASIHQDHRRLGAKVDVVYSLLGMLGSTEGRDDMSPTLLAMSNSIESCLVLRQSGCLPLLVQLIHAPGQDPETRQRAARALHNVIYAGSDEKVGRREARVLRLLEQVRDYCQLLQTSLEAERPPDDLERHPGPTIAALMKLSFDEAHRQAMCQLGGLHAVAELIEMDHVAHGSDSDDQSCITLRRYAGMALTNLTFGDGNNKALLCSFREFMKALVSQLSSMSDDLRQVTASVLRNLSWRADSSSKQTLREVGAVTGLMRAAMAGRKESTLKSILSALWNLSAHCSTNKVDICAVEGALAFLVDMLIYKAPSKTLSIVENAGGILRNVSSHIAVREDYREIIRERGCLQVLLRQLRSPSLTVVSNACGALWNLSARCPHDQRLLWDLGAVPMLRSLVHSKHKMISMGSSAALKNLLTARPGSSNLVHLDSTARGLGLPTLPSLVARRQRALEQEIDQNLSETCENIEPNSSPTNKDHKFSFNVETIAGIRNKVAYQSNQTTGSTAKNNGIVPRSESRESMQSVTSTHSDTIFERVHRHLTNATAPTDLQLKQQSSSLHSTMGNFNTQGVSGIHNKTSQLEKKYALRYNNTITERRPAELNINDVDNLRSTMSWATGPGQESIEGKLSPTESTKSSIPTYKSRIRAPAVIYMSNELLSPAMSHASEENPFEDCAVTDLDKPTDYSLRYAERNSDEDDKLNAGYFGESEQDQVEDTVKTYYTEGTPRETSLNSSRAASQSDLQDDHNKKRLLTIKLDERHIVQCGSSSRVESPKPQSIPLNSLEDSDIDFGMRHESDTDEQVQEKVAVSSPTRNFVVVDNETKIINDAWLNGPEIGVVRKQNFMIETENLASSRTSGSDGDAEEEDLLAACIHIGMHNNRHRQSFRRNNLEADLSRGESNLTRYQTSSTLDKFETINVPLNENELLIEKSELNININSCEDNLEETSEFTSIEDNLNVDEDKDRITMNYQKFNEQLETIVTESTIEIIDNSVDLIDENDCSDGAAVNYDHKTGQQPSLETISSESIESYDSVERSEQVLLELCMKSGTNTENIAPYESKSSVASLKNTTDVADGLCASRDAKNHNDKTRATECPTKHREDEYRRQRDPDAMIASLDRLTATLVQQTEAMRERDISAMKQSNQSDTWNEDIPNDVSFPTISMSVPLVGSFKSEETISSNVVDPSSMTTSKFIELEAFKLADAVNSEYGCNSLTSHDLEDIKPLTTVNSLVSLATTSVENLKICNSTSLPTAALNLRMHDTRRKKSLPVGVIAKRALGHHTIPTSIESLLNDRSNISQLENIKPPSMMDELLDNGDMENSMLSVASIMSEIADSKENIFETIKPSANSSLSEYLENINPPSLLNEISEIEDTTIDANTDNTPFINDTLCIDNELHTEAEVFHSIERFDDNDTDGAITPIPTEYSMSSSAESTPKKHKHHLTPKQKRQLAKERYRTYTIAAELVKKQEDERCRQKQLDARNLKLTPKQRRQEDPARFQTQTLDFFLANQTEMINNSEVNLIQHKSSIPLFSNCTSTYTKTQIKSQETEDVQTMLEKNANIVLHTLNETSKVNESLLDCETISLVSNDSEADLSLRMRLGGANKFSTYTRTNIQQPLNQEVEKLLETPRPEETLQVDEEIEQIVDETPDCSESENDENVCQPVEEQPNKPRIIKPTIISRDTNADSNNAKKSEPISPKGIRGRRRALYTNPSTRKITSQCSPIKQVNISSGIPIGRRNTSPIVRTTRATLLKQNTNIVTTKDHLKNNQKTATTVKSIPKKSSIPQRGATVATVKSQLPEAVPSCTKDKAEVKPLERQGTFTKDEPEMDNVPTVVHASPNKSKIAKPTRGSPSKTNLVASKISVRNSLLTYPSRIPDYTTTDKSFNPKVTSSGTSKRPTGTENVKISPEHTSNTKRTLGYRSNSNSSIASQNSGKTGKKLPKEATSKIASLWKKVEESKNQQKFEKPDTRQWITTANGLKTDAPTTSKLSNLRLFRSSTFEGMTKEADITEMKYQKTTKQTDVRPYGPSYRNSCDWTGMRETDAPCKIPVVTSDVKSNVKGTAIGYGTIVLRKQRNTDTTDSDPVKRLSRLGSFIRVDPNDETSQANQSPVMANVMAFNNPPQDNASNVIQTTVDENECLTAIVTASSRITAV